MTAHQPVGFQPALERLATILELNRRARQASDASELRFLIVNDTHGLTPYRQSALWAADDGVLALSGLVAVDGNAPYVQWLQKLCRHLALDPAGRDVTADDVPEELAGDWAEWLPPHVAWLSIADAHDKSTLGLILARDLPWTDREILLLNEWLEGWRFAYAQATRGKPPSWRARLRAAFASSSGAEGWYRRRAVQWAAAVLLVCLFPIRLTVLAPGELVPYRPSTLRAPLDGVVDAVLVQPNQTVRRGQPLFRIDTALSASKRTAGVEALAAAEAEYRQAMQQALFDDQSKARLAELMGKIEQRRAEADYLEEQVSRGTVVAPREGIVLFDDPSELQGRPVATGERVMRIADPSDAEIEAWVAVGDAVPLRQAADVRLFLDARPLDALSGRLRYFAHEAVERPDGSYAYRVRARLEERAGRIGLKGTAKLHGDRVPLIYWVVRRPLAAIRAYIGL
jgi:hypothetical protein